MRFDPTLGSNNLGLKKCRIKNHHIFGIARTSAFIWHIWIPLKKFCNATGLRLHSFGPLWTISTGSQWEISEVGRLSCFIDFFAWFYIVCGRYTSDYAHFTFSDTIHFHGSGGLILWYDLRLWLMKVRLTQFLGIAPKLSGGDASTRKYSSDVCRCDFDWNEILILVTL